MSSCWPGAVLFDFDGVIVNSEPLHFLAFHEVLRAERIELTEAEYYRELIGFDDKGAFKYLFSKRGLPLPPKTFLALMANKSRAMMDLIQDALVVASINRAKCDVCAHIFEMTPRDVPDFLAAFDRSGPVLDQDRITVGGIWTFARRDFLYHESDHGR